jgi:hypothetical protein
MRNFWSGFFLLLTIPAIAAPIVPSNVEVRTGPQTFTIGSLTANNRMFLILEREGYIMPNDQVLETLNQGTTYTNLWPGLTTTVTAGTKVDVWLLHFNRSGILAGSQAATINFTQTILGLAGRAVCGLPNAVCPADTDVHGNPLSTYPTIQLGRGIDLFFGLLADSIRLEDATTISVSLQTSSITQDQIRIFTTSAIPEPTTYALLALPLAALVFRKAGKRGSRIGHAARGCLRGR